MVIDLVVDRRKIPCSVNIFRPGESSSNVIVSDEIVECPDGELTGECLENSGFFTMTIGEKEAESIEQCESSVLATAHPAIRKALAKHLEEMSKKKLRKSGVRPKNRAQSKNLQNRRRSRSVRICDALRLRQGRQARFQFGCGFPDCNGFGGTWNDSNIGIMETGRGPRGKGRGLRAETLIGLNSKAGFPGGMSDAGPAGNQLYFRFFFREANRIE